MKTGCRWFYGRYKANGIEKEINLGVEIKGQRPDRITGQGDKAFEESKLEAAVALEILLRDIKTHKTQEQLARAVYAAQTGGQQVPTYLIKDLYGVWLNKPRKRPPADQWKQHCKVVIDRYLRFMRVKYPSIKTTHQVTPVMARAFLVSEEERGVSAHTYNDALSLMKCVFKETEATAFKREIKKAEGTIHRIPYSKDEIIDIKEAAQSHDFIRPIIITAICTGMRLGDCCRLKWSDINFTQNIVRVKTSKTDKTICVPIFDWLADELHKHKKIDRTDYVFPNQELKYRSNPKHLMTCLQRVLEQAGFGDRCATFTTSPDQIDLPDLKCKVDEYLKVYYNQNKASKMKTLFDEYISGKTMEEARIITKVGSGTASSYLNELEQHTQIPFIRGKRRPFEFDKNEVRKPVTVLRETGLLKASLRGFHAFRTTWVTLALQANVPTETVRLVTGHTTVKVVIENYYNPSEGDLKKVLYNAMPFSDSKEVA